MGEGGTIPFMAMLGKHFPDAQFLITGVLGPHSNAHGPNEFLHVPYAKKLTACVADVLAAHATRGRFAARSRGRLVIANDQRASKASDAYAFEPQHLVLPRAAADRSLAMSMSNTGRGGASRRRASSPSSCAVPSQHQSRSTWTSCARRAALARGCAASPG